MNKRNLWDQFVQSPISIKMAAVAVVMIWGMVLVTLIAGASLLFERPGQALQPPPGAGVPTIALDPTIGQTGTAVTVRGEGWTPGALILIYWMAPGEAEPPNYAIASFTADAEGRFTTGFAVPSDLRWQNQGLATVIARVADSGVAAHAFFSVVSSQPQLTQTPTVPVEPSATPTLVLPPSPTPTRVPGQPMATATTDLNIRSGPGTAYLVLGVLRAGQAAEVTGISPDGNWWQIKFSGVADGRGWLSASYVIAQNTGNVPVVQGPQLPATPTATPTPVVITDWRGEYYNNLNLSGGPVLVRNDFFVNFDWGTGSPASGVPADNFSVRWARNLTFPAGSYRFYVRVDDGVRLWIDGNLVIDQWHDSAPTTYSADVNLIEGGHSLRMEYYERGGGALAQLAWERLENYPDWKAEYYSNRKLEGSPVLVRNETKIDHDWRQGSPGPGVPADNFSVRWTRQVDFKSGTYVVRVRVDDGVRLWVDDTLVVDSWKDGSSRLIEVDRQINGGKRQVKVEYYERTGGAQIEVTWQRKEEPANQPPQAVISGPTTISEGSSVTFDGSGSRDPDGYIVKYEWDFNYDGSTFTVNATGQAVSTGYPDGPATVTLALRVTDDKGGSHIATTQVHIENVAPTVEAGGPYVGQVGSPISMAGTATDPGLVDQVGLIYHWDFGDGTQGSGPLVSHAYVEPGTYTVVLTVTDKDGAQGTDTATVRVSAINQPPLAAIDGPPHGLTGETLSFSGGASSDNDGRIVSYIWDFGDGGTGSGVKASHVYRQPGNYLVTLTVTDDGGLTGKATYTIQIEQPVPINQPPTAVIGGLATASVSQTVQFDASASTDSDGQIVSYGWDFGDGVTASGMTVTHVYMQVGNYQVTLTVTDNGGLADEATHSIQIEQPVQINLPPTVIIQAPATAPVGQEVEFDGSGSFDPEGTSVTLAWDFGDGAVGSGERVGHSYQQSGAYMATLTVTDASGLSNTATHPISVTAAPTD